MFSLDHVELFETEVLVLISETLSAIRDAEVLQVRDNLSNLESMNMVG